MILSIQTMSYQRPNLYPQLRKVPHSANPCSKERYDTPESETFDGCCMAVIRAGEAAGEIHLTVTADDGVQKQLTILVQKAEG